MICTPPAYALLSVTSWPELTVTLRRLFAALPSAIFPVVAFAVSVVPPPTLIAPDWLMPPLAAVTLSVPPAVTPGNTVFPLACVTLTLPPLVTLPPNPFRL